MGTVDVQIGGRNYPLSCRDGDEPHLVDLAAVIADKVQGLTKSLGTMTEARLLLMAALMVADELFEARKGSQPARLLPRDTEPELSGRLIALLHRAETLAAQLEA